MRGRTAGSVLNSVMIELGMHPGLPEETEKLRDRILENDNERCYPLCMNNGDVLDGTVILRDFLGLGLEQVLRTADGPQPPVEGDEYGRMKGLTSVDLQQPVSATLYLRNGVVELVRIGPAGCVTISPDALRARFQGTPLQLRSPAGKLGHIWVYAEEGIAFSGHRETVHFIELFRPCTGEAYKTHIYREPHPFIR